MQLTDEQVLTAAIAIVVPISALIYSNSRITDVNTRITDVKETIRAEMRLMKSELSAEIRALFHASETALKEHVAEHHHEER